MKHHRNLKNRSFHKNSQYVKKQYFSNLPICASLVAYAFWRQCLQLYIAAYSLLGVLEYQEGE